jgi:hypothetical protein
LGHLELLIQATARSSQLETNRATLGSQRRPENSVVYCIGSKMTAFCLRCRIFGRLELNVLQERARNYHWGLLASPHQASSRAQSGGARTFLTKSQRQANRAKYERFVPFSRTSINRTHYSSSFSQGQILEEVDPKQCLNMVYVGVGSNIGDRLKNIEDACDKIDRIPGTKITQTSSLWETKAMYLEDQPDFYNAVCEVGQHLMWYHRLITLRRYQQTWTQLNCSTNSRPSRTNLAGHGSSTKALGP